MRPHEQVQRNQIWIIYQATVNWWVITKYYDIVAEKKSLVKLTNSDRY
ncbi:hypothetical protein [Calothrix rhizosoleniae]|nr:hypothetical protein [Calothrix rhizosoleniae]